MIMTDFILSGRDCHLSNVSILRDADTLQFMTPAPIYDSGKCLFVQDRSCVDMTKLPERSWIEGIYSYDSKMDESRMKLIGEAYF